jgi:hypothetical protein
MITIFKKGNTAQNDNYVGINGEVTIDTTKKTIRVHDGTTLGGTEIALSDLSNTQFSTLEENLSQEIQDRLDADDLLDGRITTLESVNPNDRLNALEFGLSQEISDRQQDDLTLTNSINQTNLELQAEILERQGNDTNQTNRIIFLENDHVTLTQWLDHETRLDQIEIDLPAEIQNRIDDVADLQNQITTEVQDRIDAINAIDLRIDDVELHHLHTNTFYANQGVTDIQGEIDNVGTLEGQVLFATSGSFAGNTLTVNNKVDLAIVAPDIGDTITTLSLGRGLTIDGTSEKIRFANIKVEGTLNITGTKGRHIFSDCVFQGGVNIDATTDTSNTFILFHDCDFENQNINISNLTNCVVYFDSCNLNNQRIITTNNASPYNVILLNCITLNSLQTPITSGVVLAGTTGYYDNSVKNFATSSEFINLGTGVITTFTGSYNELLNKPTLVTSASDLSDYNTLLLTSMKGVANGVAELDSNGLIPNHHIPPLALTKPYVVQTIADRDALTGINTGDVAIVVNDPTPSNNGNYIYDADLPSWIALYNSTAPVNQVNGQTGDVLLNTGDISEGVGSLGQLSQLYFTDQRAINAVVTSNINTNDLAPSTQTVKSYVTGITDALDTRLSSVEDDALTHVTITYVDNALSGKVDTTSYTANDVLTKLLTVDGSGSGIDADLLDGLNSSGFVKLATTQTVTGDKDFTGSLTAVTQTNGNNSTKVATTAYVDSAISGFTSVSGIRTAVGLDDSDTWSLPSSYYLTGQSVITGALNVLDSQVYSANTINTSQNTALGLNSNGTKNDFTNTNYITANSSFYTAINTLDNAINTVASNVPTINALSDIANVNVAENLGDDGKYLKWDNTSSKWIADNVPAGYTDNNAKDTVGAMFEIATGDIIFTYDELNRTISTAVSTGSIGITQINGYTDPTVTLAALDLQTGFSPSYYTPSTGDIKAHLQAIDTAFNTKAGLSSNNSLSGINTFSNDAKYDVSYTLALSDDSKKFASTEWVVDKLGSLTGALTYKGGYNASTGTPSLATSVIGDVYAVDVAGTLAGVTLTVGDLIIFKENVVGGTVQSTDFNKIDQEVGVVSVNNLTGTVTLTGDNVNSAFSPTNYTIANAKIDSHLSGINTKFASMLTLSGNNTWTGTNNFTNSVTMASASSVTVPTAGVDYATNDTKAVNRTYLNAYATSQLLTKAGNLSGLANTTTARTNLGLGTVATLNTGTANGNVPVLGASGLPAVGGSLLTSLPSIDALSDVVIISATNGQVLSYNGTNWINSAPGAAMSRVTVISTSSNAYVPASVPSGTIEVFYYLTTATSGTVTLTNIPATGNTGLKLIFKKITGAYISILPASGETIDGFASGTDMIQQYSSLTLISTGSVWSII